MKIRRNRELLSFMRKKKHELAGYIWNCKDKDLKKSAKNLNNIKVWFFCFPVDEKRKSKTTPAVLLEIIKEEGL